VPERKYGRRRTGMTNDGKARNDGKAMERQGGGTGKAMNRGGKAASDGRRKRRKNGDARSGRGSSNGRSLMTGTEGLPGKSGSRT